MLLLI